MQTTDQAESFARLPETIALIAGIALFLLLVYQIIPVLSPFLVLGAILFLLYPSRHHLYIRRIMWLSVFLFVVWFFNSLLGVLTPFIIAFLLAYILNPLVCLFERRSVPRWASSLAIIILLGALVLSLLVMLVPVVLSQSRGILGSISDAMKNGAEFVREGRLTEVLKQYGLPAEQFEDFISNELPARIDAVLKALVEGAFGFLTGVTSIVSHVVDAIIIPFIAFYLLKDFPMIADRLQSLVPVSRRNSVVSSLLKVDELLGKYLRGILLVAMIQAVGVTVGLAIIGVQFPLVLGVMSGILNLIPFVGFYLSLVVAAIVAVISGGSIIAKIIAVAVLYVGLNILENTVLGPKIVGEKLGMHPVLLILSLVVFGYFLGFVGLVIAVPATATILMFWRLRGEDSISQSSNVQS